jgi:hypothetical protein
VASKDEEGSTGGGTGHEAVRKETEGGQAHEVRRQLRDAGQTLRQRVMEEAKTLQQRLGQDLKSETKQGGRNRTFGMPPSTVHPSATGRLGHPPSRRPPSGLPPSARRSRH